MTERGVEVGVEVLELEDEGASEATSGAKSSRVSISRRRGKFKTVACYTPQRQ